jgi:hypothetical protein
MDDLQQEVYLLVQRYVQRQQISVEMMRKYQSHLSETRRSIHRNDVKVTPLGYWGQDDEWEYFLYEGGCKVTHKVSGEVIGWDAPDVSSFNARYFIDWLMWYLNQPANPSNELIQDILLKNPYPAIFQKEVLDLLEQLRQAGKLERVYTTHYVLIGGVDGDLSD